MKNSNKTKLLSTALALTMAAALTGCSLPRPGTGTASGSQVTAAVAGSQTGDAAGAVLLSVNPEILLRYDDAGRVLTLEGINADGQEVLTHYTGYAGRDCATVAGELVEQIYAGGYLDAPLDGRARNIVVKLQEGSLSPDDAFLEGIASGIQTAVADHGGASAAMVVDQDDLDDQGLIGMEAARDLVLAQTGLTEAAFRSGEYELDDGVYELSFTANGILYEYEVDARTGKVLEADLEHNDDWAAIHSSAAAYDDWDDIYDDDRDDVYDDIYDNDRDDAYDDIYDDDRDDVYDDIYDDDRDDVYDDIYDDDRDDVYDDIYDDDQDDVYDDIYDDDRDDVYDDIYDDDRDDDWDDNDDDWDDDDDDDWDDDDD